MWALDGSEWSASGPGQIAPPTPYIAGWVGPRAGLGAVKYRKIACPYRESNPGRPARSSSLYGLNYSGSPRPKHKYRSHQRLQILL
jgi:hypothetical protein